MPGQVLTFGRWKSGELVVKRPTLYFSSSRPEELKLEFTPPPLLFEAFDGDLEQRLVRRSPSSCTAPARRRVPVLLDSCGCSRK